MGAKKNTNPPVKCKCPKCGTEYTLRIFVFDYKPNKIYHKYCKTCKGMVENFNGDYIADSAGRWIKEGKSNNG